MNVHSPPTITALTTIKLASCRQRRRRYLTRSEHETVIKLRYVLDKPRDSGCCNFRFVLRDRSSCSARVLSNAECRFHLARYRCFNLGPAICPRRAPTLPTQLPQFDVASDWRQPILGFGIFSSKSENKSSGRAETKPFLKPIRQLHPR